MFKPFGSLARQGLFWILFFNLSRILFLIFHLPILRAEQIPFTEIAGVFLYSFKLDLATTCYFLILPFFIRLVQEFYHAGWLNTINRVYTGILIAVYSLTVAGETGIYAEWKTKLTYKVIKYLRNPDEIYNSASTGTFFLLLALFVVLAASGIVIYNRYFYRRPEKMEIRPVRSGIFLLLTSILLFIGMRGGIRQIPINQSQSYFSGFNILNMVSVNNAFNLYISIFENLKNFDRNPYVFMPEKQAAKIMEEIYHVQADTTVSVLRTGRPNIILLILESWSADLIEDLGGKPGITPEFKKLQQGGILFDQIYSSGMRSEQGMASIFSGFPSHPVSSITVQPDKIVRLPSLVRTLKQAGYSSSFYFGGQLIYGNIKSYILFNGFDKVMEGVDFPADLPEGKLGIHDQYTLGYLLKDVGQMKPPFFASLFTLSTHSPWDQPYEKPLQWGDNEREYINAAYYTDHCLGEFFRSAARAPWYSNTLFIVVADHSHNSYYNRHPHMKEYRRIPMLFFGDVIREEFRGTRWSKLGNQHDLPATLLAQLGLPWKNFPYSKNLFNPASGDFAYYSTEDGVGWVRPSGYFTMEKTGNYFYPWSDPHLSDSVRQEGLAFLQTVFGDYVSK